MTKNHRVHAQNSYDVQLLLRTYQYENLSWDLPKNQSNVIKVIGVGGGGSNAINYMYNKGINGAKTIIAEPRSGCFAMIKKGISVNKTGGIKIEKFFNFNFWSDKYLDNPNTVIHFMISAG